MARTGKRQEIVDAALRMLAERGAEGFTAAGLADAAGVSKANIFHHFENLDDVLLAAFEQFLLGMEMFAPPPGATLRDWLLGLGIETVAMMEEQRSVASAYVAFAARAQSNERLRRRMAETVAKAERGFAAAIEQLAPKRLPRAEVATLAALILIAGDGLALHRHLFPERAATQDAAWRDFVDRIVPEEAGS